MNKDTAMMNNDALQNSSVSEVVLSWHLKKTVSVWFLFSITLTYEHLLFAWMKPN